MMQRTFIFILLLFPAALFAEIIGQEVEYEEADVIFKGYLAYDDALKEKRPGVLVVHEWWGHNDYARKRARMLAEAGYIAFAVDMYGDGKTAGHPDDAGKFSSMVMQLTDHGRARFLAAMEALKNHEQTDSEHIAAIGYCFGGGMVLEMARTSVDLDVVASFHGSLVTPTTASSGSITSRIVAFHGEDDPFVPPEKVDQFRSEMDAAGADYELVVYPGVKHSFTNPDANQFAEKFDLPLEYNEAADKDSWSRMLIVFKEVFE